MYITMWYGFFTVHMLLLRSVPPKYPRYPYSTLESSNDRFAVGKHVSCFGDWDSNLNFTRLLDDGGGRWRAFMMSGYFFDSGEIVRRIGVEVGSLQSLSTC